MLKIIFNHKFPNWNDIINTDRYNKYAGAKLKKKEMEEASIYLKNIPKIEKYPIKINCIWYVKNINSDLDNNYINNRSRSFLNQIQG